MKHSSVNSPSVEGTVMARYLETANVLFCDGHVKSMKFGALMELANGSASREPQ